MKAYQRDEEAIVRWVAGRAGVAERLRIGAGGLHPMEARWRGGQRNRRSIRKMRRVSSREEPVAPPPRREKQRVSFVLAKR